MNSNRKKWLKKTVLISSLAFLAVLGVFFWFYYPAIKLAKPGPRVSLTGGGLPPGCTCHSKNRRFVAMHQLFSVEDCRKCHQKGENLMGKKSSAMTSERRAALGERIRREAICQECHRGGRTVVTKKSEISGRLFCPTDKKIYKKNDAIKRDGKYYCPKHGIELIDIDEIALKSGREPKNEYCIACHPLEKDLQRKHQKVVAASRLASFENCLKCHTSHSQCGGCHF